MLTKVFFQPSTWSRLVVFFCGSFWIYTRIHRRLALADAGTHLQIWKDANLSKLGVNEGHKNVQISAEPGIELGRLNDLEGRRPKLRKKTSP